MDSSLLIAKSLSTEILALMADWQPSNGEHWEWLGTKDEDENSWIPAKMAFAGFTLEGRAYTGDMPPSQRRLSDLLNYGPTFFLFETDDGPWIVNRDLLNHLVPLA